MKKEPLNPFGCLEREISGKEKSVGGKTEQRDICRLSDNCLLTLATKFGIIKLGLVSLNKHIFISQYCGMVMVSFYFKKGCHAKNAFTTIEEMFLNTLSKFLRVQSSSVISASFTQRAFRLANII